MSSMDLLLYYFILFIIIIISLFFCFSFIFVVCHSSTWIKVVFLKSDLFVTSPVTNKEPWSSSLELFSSFFYSQLHFLLSHLQVSFQVHKHTFFLFSNKLFGLVRCVIIWLFIVFLLQMVCSNLRLWSLEETCFRPRKASSFKSLSPFPQLYSFSYF